MKTIARSLPPLFALLLAACSNPQEESSEAAAKSTVEGAAPSDVANVKQVPVEAATASDLPENRFAEWAGKWTGPEGMFVDIEALGDGQFELEMQSDLDTKGSYKGSAEEHGIRFERNGEPLLLYRANGDETGLKYLAGKKECLMVKQGEGYCRD